MAPPIESNDIFELANTILGRNSNQNNIRGASGFSTRQDGLPNERIAVNKRKQMLWLLPGGKTVGMYVNPQSISYPYKKTITQTRTKGGYCLQYWGPELIPLRISGTTGTSGIEGINVLHDVYMNEQLIFDYYALALASQTQQNDLGASVFGSGNAFSNVSNFGENILSTIFGSYNNQIISNRNLPSLAQMSFTVELYWSGEVYRGFFSDFNVNETAQNVGLFDYDITFNATQKRGFRQNFLAWHRSPTSGLSDSDPITGRPYSFKYSGQ